MVALTLTEAASVLEPPITEHQLRIIIRALAIQPVGNRYSGQAGRPQATYDATELTRLAGALAPWLETSDGLRQANWYQRRALIRVMPLIHAGRQTP